MPRASSGEIPIASAVIVVYPGYAIVASFYGIIRNVLFKNVLLLNFSFLGYVVCQFGISSVEIFYIHYIVWKCLYSIWYYLYCSYNKLSSKRRNVQYIVYFVITMKCVYCKSNTRVTDKRESPGGTRRRRECLKCKKRFTTYEKADKRDLIIVKKDGRREPFSVDKLRDGLRRACMKRPISVEKIDKLIGEIEEKLGSKGKEVKSNSIGKMVMSRLKRLDKIAYIRFASVYMDFKNVKDFKEVISEV